MIDIENKESEKMNSGNKLLLGILAFVVACVVGYALFSESITITGSASAKGDWDIDVSCTKGVSDSLLQGIDITRKEAGSFINYAAVEDEDLHILAIQQEGEDKNEQ